MADFARLDELAAERMQRWSRELLEFCAIPSEAADPSALQAAADWTARRLGRLGANIDIVELDDAPALVIGEVGVGPRTLNLVQHYDVQPAVPLELWTTPPYEPAVRDGALYARGAADNKGELMARIWAVEAYQDALGPLPCRLRFLVEGEEESGSQHLDELLDRRPALRTADGALIEGGGVDAEGRPWLDCGVRGMLHVQLYVRTIAYDAHSSVAMLLPNAAQRLVAALASLYDAEGGVAFAGFDQGVRPPTTDQLAVTDALPLDELAELKQDFKIDRFLLGRDGIEANRARMFEPTCNIQGLWSGYTGPGMKTITPAEARARLDIRLVPDQGPDAIRTALRAHLDTHGYADVEIDRDTSSERPYWSPTDDPIVDAAARAVEPVFGRPAVRNVGLPGTAPMYQVCGRDRVPMTSIGGVHNDCHAHAPDEHYRLDLAELAVRALGRFYAEFAALG